MLNILSIYKSVPYTTEAMKLLRSGWSMPGDLEVPCLSDD